KSSGILRRWGAWAVFFARFLPVVRTLTAAAAGTVTLPFRKFLPAVIAGTICWSALHISLGAALGEAARKVEDVRNTGGTIVVTAATAVLLIVFIHHKRNRNHHTTGTASQDPGPIPTHTSDTAGNDSSQLPTDWETDE